MYSCYKWRGPMNSRPGDFFEQSSITEVDCNVALFYPGDTIGYLFNSVQLEIFVTFYANWFQTFLAEPVERIDKGSDGDKDSNDEKNSREEDTGHANEKSISKVLSTGGTRQGHPTSQVKVLFHREWQRDTTHAAGQD